MFSNVPKPKEIMEIKRNNGNYSPTPKNYIAANGEKINELLGEKERNFPDYREGAPRH